MRLGEILVRTGAATREQVDAGLREQEETRPRRRLGDILLESKMITESDLLQALAEQFGLPFVVTVDDRLLEPALIERLPVDWARTHCILPVRYSGGVGMLTTDPTSMDAQDDLSLMLGDEVAPVLATRDTIQSAIERCYFSKPDSAEAFLQQMEETADSPLHPRPGADDLLRVSEEAPVSQLVNLVLLQALKSGASDIHVEPLEDTLRVRYRIDGVLYEQASPPKHMEAALISRLKVMGRIDIAEKRLPQDGMARVRVGEREIDIRVSTVPVAEGERVVLRLLDRNAALLPLSELGMPANVLASFRELLRGQQGVMLITGPTGSGKTTTLYAALQELDTEHSNVLTVEDPIEYQLPNIGQIQVKPKIGLTFAHGLRHILRQDPDVILVGETRDLETAEIMIRASLTGHLVFTTLHTNDAVSAVVRLADMGIEPYLLSASLRGALAQRLVRTLCPACRRPGSLTDEDRGALGQLAERLDGVSIWEAAGCDACLGGYRGRTGLYELMVVTEDVRAAIRGGAALTEVRAMAAGAGMTSLLESGIDAVARGVTSVAEMLRAVGTAAGESSGG